MKNPYIIVLGNEKGGSGKTTTSMHLIFGLMSKGYKVGCLDLDIRQLSLRRYLENRIIHHEKEIIENKLLMPKILDIDVEVYQSNSSICIESYYSDLLYSHDLDFIVIDTPGSNNLISSLAHSFADLIITPINDSFIDLDLIAKVDTLDVKNMKPSIYSAMIWEQKIRRFKRDKRKIEWIIIRNRLSNLDSSNRRLIEKCLNHLSKNLIFRFANGFSERIIYRELFPYGLTLLDIFDGQALIKVTPSHIAARQELRNFLNDLRIPILHGHSDWFNQDYDLYKEIEDSNIIINLTDRVLV